ncbi:MAG TPA: BA14K family protein [Aestuariivirga sp.]|nr:BA14K family protein [Aestuariivirga sp.]
MLRACALALLAFTVTAPLALADVRGHCEAYALDFATAQAAEGPMRQHKHDIALAGCLGQYGGAAAASAAKPAAAAPAPRPKSAAKPKTTVVVPAVAAVPAVKKSVPPAAAKREVKNGIVVGSAAWKAYCAAKYTSFDVARGTYTSMTGKERPCLVTRTKAPY